MPNYTVQQGDCILSISKQAGYLWTSIWNHPNNSALKASRKNPNILLPGDIVFVPDKEVKELPGATDQKHQFVVKRPATKLRLQLLTRKHEPRASLEYSLDVDGTPHSGSTDSQGFIELPIPADAKQAVLTVQEDGKTETYRVKLGGVDPLSEDSGIRQRLTNLGYPCLETSAAGDPLPGALQDFQRRYQLPVTGQGDDTTKEKLRSVHGS